MRIIQEVTNARGDFEQLKRILGNGALCRSGVGAGHGRFDLELVPAVPLLPPMSVFVVPWS